MEGSLLLWGVGEMIEPSIEPHDLLARITSKASEIQATHLEMFAAAYLKETSIPASEAELVQEFRDMRIVWYFRRRTK